MSQRARIRMEAEQMLGPKAREAWEKQEDREQAAAHVDAEAEFRRNMPKSKQAWDNKAFEEQFKAEQEGEAEFLRKSPAAKKAWHSVGKSPNAATFLPMGGKRKSSRAKQRKTRSKTQRRRKPKRSKKSKKNRRK